MPIDITDVTRRVQYAGSGTGPYNFTFNIIEDTDVAVYQDDTALALSTDYSVTINPDGTGYVTTVASMTGSTVTIIGARPYQRLTDFTTGGDFTADAVNDEFDGVHILLQQLRDRADRALTMSDTVSDSISNEFPLPGAGQYIRWNAGGTALEAVSAVNDTGNYTASGTGAVSRSITSKLYETISPEDFGAVGDGVTDDLTPMTNFINALLDGDCVEGLMPPKIYAISGALPNITRSGVKLTGAGPSRAHDVGTAVSSGTVIKKIGGAGGTMLTVAPTEGASAQSLTGVQITGITFDANSLAAKGVVVKSLTKGLLDIGVLNATTTGLELNVSTTLGESRDTQLNRINYFGRQLEAPSGVSMRLIGDSGANVSFNLFENVTIQHKDALAIIEENADNNVWASVRLSRAGGGTATNSIEWRGGATSAESCRTELFQQLSATVAPIAKGTGTYTVGTSDIRISYLDKGNSTPDPTVETGATCYWYNSSDPIYSESWTQTTPTVTSQTGSFTSVSCTLRCRRQNKIVNFNGAITITTNGTAAGYISVPLPYTHADNVVGSTAVGLETAVTGYQAQGYISPNTANLIVRKYDGTYLGGNGYIIAFSGAMEIA